MKGTKIHKKYKIVKTLNKGTFSEMFLAEDKNKLSPHRYVIKKFRPILGNSKAKEIKQEFYKEAKILQRLSGKNSQIPQLYEYFMDGEDFYLVREWIEGITLKQKVQQEGKLPEAEVKRILSSILSILQYIHSHGLVYRQLKPSSIVLRQIHWLRPTTEPDLLPVPIYFGGVKELEQQAEQIYHDNIILAKKHEYTSPEQQQGQSVYASDLYSLGLTAIYLLTAKTPAELTCDAYSKKLLWQQEAPNLKTNLVRVIDRAICPNPQDRFNSADGMWQALNSKPVIISASLTSQPKDKSFLTPEIKIISMLFLLGLGVIGIIFALLNWDFAQLIEDYNNHNDFDDDELVINSQIETTPQELDAIAISSQTETIPKKSNDSFDVKPKKTLNIPIFPVGTSQAQIISSLGEPTKQSQGYWGNSQALLYRDFASNQVDLGYLSDNATQTIRQTEMSFVESVDLATIQQAVRQLLSDNYSAEIEQNIEQVFSYSSDRQNFKINNLEGVIQRNPQNRIYIGIWEAGFHRKDGSN